MRAERDEDQIRPPRSKPQRRLAYEIALGIILGGAGLATSVKGTVDKHGGGITTGQFGQ